jgi:hypothetical protein
METEICRIIGKNANLDALKNEDVLQNDITIVEIPTAIGEMAKCKDHLQITGKPIGDLNLTMNSIQFGAFDKLFGYATKLRGTSTQRYVTGLRVHLGIKGSEVVLLFQPTCLIKSSNANEPNRYYAFDGLYYSYSDQTKFVPATEDELIYITNYQSIIRIKHHGADTFERLDQNGDTTSIIIPFQVIYSLIYDNEPHTDVFLFNAILNGSNKINHTVLMGTGNDSDGKQAFTGEYTGKYANRSHLCPPCNYVETMVIARPGPTTCP